MKHTVSACLVVYNEEKMIRQCLESLRGHVDEIVVVHDGPCSDATLDIAREYTKEVHIGPRRGTSEGHRVDTFERAHGEWILIIDADESLSPELASHLPELAASQEYDGYAFLWSYSEFDTGIKRGFFVDNIYKMTMFRRSAGYFVGLHEQWARVRGRYQNSRYRLEHHAKFNYFTEDAFRRKYLPWARLFARNYLMPRADIPTFNLPSPATLDAMLARTRHPLLWAVYEPCHFFLYGMIYRKGILGGLPSLRAGWIRMRYLFLCNYYIYRYQKEGIPSE